MFWIKGATFVSEPKQKKSSDYRCEDACQPFAHLASTPFPQNKHKEGPPKDSRVFLREGRIKDSSVVRNLKRCFVPLGLHFVVADVLPCAGGKAVAASASVTTTVVPSAGEFPPPAPD